MALTKSEAVFLQAACEGELAYIRSHIHKVNPKCSGPMGYTALMHAAENGHRETLEFLLPFSDPNARSRYSRTALILAAEEGDMACVNALVAHTNPNLQNKHGYTALMAAVVFGRMECAMELAKVTDISLQSTLGATARELADSFCRVPHFGPMIENVALAARESRAIDVHIARVATASSIAIRL